jgi:hypothetical protein
LVGKHRFEQMLAALNGGGEGESISLDLELVYGHCWGGGPGMDPTNVRIDASRISHRRA